MNTFKTLISVIAAGAIIDFLGIYLLVGPVIKKEIGVLLRTTPKWGAVALVYVVMAVIVVFFVLPKIDSSGVIRSALIWGGLAGFCVYGVYEFTNYSLLKDWTLKTLIVDMAWGTFFGASVTVVAVYIQKFFS